MPLYKNTDLEALRQHLPVKGKFEIKLLLTVVHDVEEEYIIPALGQAQYDELNDAYAALEPPDELFPALGALLKKCQAAIAPLCFLHSMDMLNANITNTGIQIHVDDNTKPAFEWQVERIKHMVNRIAFNRIESLFLFLEANKADYPDWVSGPGYTLHRECLVPTAEAFTKVFARLNNSRQLYQLLRPLLMQQQEEVVRLNLGDDLYEELMAEVLADTVSVANAKLLPHIRNAMGYSTITMALREFSLTLEPAGLMLNFTTGMVAKQKPAPDLMLSTLATHCEERASLFLARLVAYLDINAATYPLYPAPEADEGFDNKEDSGIYML